MYLIPLFIDACWRIVQSPDVISVVSAVINNSGSFSPLDLLVDDSCSDGNINLPDVIQLIQCILDDESCICNQ